MDIKKNLKGWLAGRRHKDEDQNRNAALKVPAEGPEDPRRGGTALAPAAAEAVEPEVIAVIAAVVAVEVKMFLALQGRSYTFGGSGQGQGWSEWGRLLVRPYQGVR